MKRLALLPLLALLAAAPVSGQTAVRLLDVDDNHDTGRESSSPHHFLVLGERVVFIAQEPGTGNEVWASDGTPAGTELLRDACPGFCSSGAELLGAESGLAWWAASPDEHTDEENLWRTDGTRAGTAAVLAGGSPLRLGTDIAPWSHAFLGGVLYVSACGERLGCGIWRTDGTAAGTRLAIDRKPLDMAAAGGQLFFLADGRLWASDGTEAGTRNLAGVPLETGELVAAGARIFFFARRNGEEALWTSDGTAAGTHPLLRLPASGGFPRFGLPGEEAILFKVFGNRLYFVADDGLQGEEIWVSDGTPKGTRRVTGLAADHPFDPLLDARDLEETGGRLVFLASDGLGTGVWVTDGRPQSTTLLREICPGACSFADRDLAQAGGRVFFVADGNELWNTDGTPAGTRKIRAFVSLHSLRPLLGGVVFVAATPEAGIEIWRSNGTAAGTRPLTAFGEGESPSAFQPAATPGGKIFFSGFSRYGDDSGSTTGARRGWPRTSRARTGARSLACSARPAAAWSSTAAKTTGRCCG